MGVVYRARQVVLNRVVALKMIPFRLDLIGEKREEVLARFRREAESIAQLQHPNVVQVFEVGTHSGGPFLALEYLPGGSLDRRLGGKPQPPADAAQLVYTLARAVHSAHAAGIVHRDLKPANVLMTADGTPKIADFGLARSFGPESIGAQHLTTDGALVGTPAYMAPEQARGKTAEVGPGSDVWALGAILYEMLTGKPPFLGATSMDTLMLVLTNEPAPPRLLQPKVPRDLETICLKCLQKEPSRRYATALALADDLERFIAGKPVAARRVGWLERGWRWCGRNRVLAGALTTLALTLIAGLLTMSVLWRLQAHQRRLVKEHQQRYSSLLADVIHITDDPDRLQAGAETLQGDRARELLERVQEYQDLLRQADERETRAELERSERWRGYLVYVIGNTGSSIVIFQDLIRRQEGRLLEEPKEELREELARGWLTLAFVQHQSGRFDESGLSWRRAVEVLEPIAQGEDARPAVLANLAGLHSNLGLEAARKGDLKRSEEYLLRSAALWDRLLEQEDKPAWRAGRAASDVNLGGLRFSANDLDKALALYEKARTVQAQLVKDFPGNRFFVSALTATCHAIALLHMRKKEFARARSALEQAKEAQKRLIQTNRDLWSWRHFEAADAVQQGRLALWQGHRQEARAQFQQAAQILEELAQLHPDDPVQGGLRLRVHASLGVIQAAERELPEARASFRKALERLKDLRTNQGIGAVADRDLGESAYLLGSGLRNIGLPGEGVVALKQAAVWQRLAVDRAGESLAVRKELSRTLFDLGECQRLSGKPDDAAATCRQRLKLWPKNADEVYDGACELVRCARLVEGERREKYLDESVQVLRQSSVLGLKGAASIRRDPDLDLLRQRADFKKLLGEIAARD
jgi:serine/threonine-protein kinase